MLGRFGSEVEAVPVNNGTGKFPTPFQSNLRGVYAKVSEGRC
ncbi:hypothetical protein [Kangiella sp. HZ709]|nr:hypothetical protein [Kangiella sp. HZ709]